MWGKGSATKIIEKVGEESAKVLKYPIQSTALLPLFIAADVLEQVEKDYGDGSGRTIRKLGRQSGKLAIEVVFTVYKTIGDIDRALKSVPGAWKKVYHNVDSTPQAVSSPDGSKLFRVCANLHYIELWAPFVEGWIQGYLEAAMGERHTIKVKAQNLGEKTEFHVTHCAQ